MVWSISGFFCMTVYHGSGSNVCLWDMFRFPDNCVWSLSNKVCNSNGPCWEHLSSNISLILVRFIGIIQYNSRAELLVFIRFYRTIVCRPVMVHWSYKNYLQQLCVVLFSPMWAGSNDGPFTWASGKAFWNQCNKMVTCWVRASPKSQ